MTCPEAGVQSYIDKLITDSVEYAQSQRFPTTVTLKNKFRHEVAEDKRNRFLKALRNAPTISRAAKAAGIDKGSLSKERKLNPEFEGQIQEILLEIDQEATDVVVETLIDTRDWKAAMAWLNYRLKAKVVNAGEIKENLQDLEDDTCPL